MPTNGTSDGDVYIVSAVRTPIGSFRGSLSSFKAPQLASIAIKSALERINLAPEHVERVVMGQAVQADSGQSQAKQALVGAGLSASSCRNSVINEVCASGMQAIIMNAIQIKYLGANCLVSVGAESMSNAPYYSSRTTPAYGGFKLSDSLIVDGLTDTFNNCHMGDCAEHTAKKYNVSREDQDNYALESYKRAKLATEGGLLAKEICPVEIPGRKNEPPVVFREDEEFKKLDHNKVKTLSPCFNRATGTITAANASSLSDGAAACVLMSSKALAKHGVTPLAKIISYGEGVCEAIDFSTSPVDAIQEALGKAGLDKNDIALWEINEAFSVVALANMKILELDPSKVNKFGGGVSIGHPLGMSGTRIVNSLVHQLQSGQYGCAAICRGGGGSAAMIIQKL